MQSIPLQDGIPSSRTKASKKNNGILGIFLAPEKKPFGKASDHCHGFAAHGLPDFLCSPLPYDPILQTGILRNPVADEGHTVEIVLFFGYILLVVARWLWVPPKKIPLKRMKLEFPVYSLESSDEELGLSPDATQHADVVHTAPMSFVGLPTYSAPEKNAFCRNKERLREWPVFKIAPKTAGADANEDPKWESSVEVLDSSRQMEKCRTPRKSSCKVMHLAAVRKYQKWEVLPMVILQEAPKTPSPMTRRSAFTSVSGHNRITSASGQDEMECATSPWTPSPVQRLLEDTGCTNVPLESSLSQTHLTCLHCHSAVISGPLFQLVGAGSLEEYFCASPDRNAFVEKDGALHAECLKPYTKNFICAQCKKTISPENSQDFYSHRGSRFQNIDFEAVKDDNFAYKFYALVGNQICHEHCLKAHLPEKQRKGLNTCNSCKSTFPGSFYKDGDRKLCEFCWEADGEAQASKCEVCEKAVRLGNFFQVGTEKVHARCWDEYRAVQCAYEGCGEKCCKMDGFSGYLYAGKNGKRLHVECFNQYVKSRPLKGALMKDDEYWSIPPRTPAFIKMVEDGGCDLELGNCNLHSNRDEPSKTDRECFFLPAFTPPPNSERFYRATSSARKGRNHEGIHAGMASPFSSIKPAEDIS